MSGWWTKTGHSFGVALGYWGHRFYSIIYAGVCHEKFGPPKNGPPGPYISKYLDPPELIF